MIEVLGKRSSQAAGVVLGLGTPRTWSSPMLSMIWMMYALSANDLLGASVPVESADDSLRDTGKVLKALPARKTTPTLPIGQVVEESSPASKSPYALPAAPAKAPVQIGLSGWGERGFVQLRFPASTSASGFQLAFGGARSTVTEKFGILEKQREYLEIQGRAGFLIQPWQELAFASCNLDLGIQLRKFWNRSSLDSNTTGIGGIASSEEPTRTRTTALGVQPSLGVEVLFWFRPQVLALQAVFRTGPEWLIGESYSGFNLHGWTSIGLVFTP